MMETNGSVSAKNEPVVNALTSETKAKIAQCLAFSMEIKDAIFYHQPDAETVSIYRIEKGVELWSYRGYYYHGARESLDRLIDGLSRHIAEMEVKNGCAGQ